MKTNPSLADVFERREFLNKRIAEMRSELDELAIAERVLRRLAEDAAGADQPIWREVSRMRAAPVPPRPPAVWSSVRIEDFAVDPTRESVEGLITIILSATEKVWWTANELQIELSRIKGTDVPMSTVSPTLTNMKNANKIVRDGLKVAEPTRAAEWRRDMNDLLGAAPQNENGEAVASPDADRGSNPDQTPNPAREAQEKGVSHVASPQNN